jgi:predicted phosphodiesterase
MRLAVISDIHGNLAALDEVLADIEVFFARVITGCYDNARRSANDC